MCNLNAVAQLVFVSQDITYKSVIEARAELDKEKQDAIDDAVVKIAKKMLLKNKSVDEIMEFTELSEKEINNIKQHIENADEASDEPQ